jgi:hypothetical protein
MVADRQYQRVGDIAVGAEQAHFSAREAFEQSPESRFIAIAAFPVDEPLGHAVVGLPEQALVSLRCRKGHISSRSITPISPGGGLAQQKST